MVHNEQVLDQMVESNKFCLPAEYRRQVAEKMVALLEGMSGAPMLDPRSIAAVQVDMLRRLGVSQHVARRAVGQV